MNISPGTVQKYLKEGKNLDLCDYKPRPRNKSLENPVEASSDKYNEVLWFNSITECCKYLKIKYNKKFSSNRILEICEKTNSRKEQYSFTFRFLNDNEIKDDKLIHYNKQNNSFIKRGETLSLLM